MHYSVLIWGLLLVLLACSPSNPAWRTAVMAGLFTGALGNTLIGIIQFFGPDANQFPQWLSSWVMPSTRPGRAVGNIGQPNHVATLTAIGAAAWGAFAASGRIKKDAAWIGMILLMFGIVLTSSRTGYVSIAFLCAWGLIDKKMSRNARLLLCSTPIMAFVTWCTLTLCKTYFGLEYGRGEGAENYLDIGARQMVWSHAIEMIKAQPWTGVGWGNFNFAWMLTPFNNRPQEIYDHVHNFELQILVELGVIIGGLVLAAIAAGFFWAVKKAWNDPTPAGFQRRAGIVVLLILGLHSQLEYPLWYPYYLLPALAAWWVAVGLGIKTKVTSNQASAADSTDHAVIPQWSAGLLGLTLVIGSALSWWDYLKISPIYEQPTLMSKSMQSRIAVGQSAIWYHPYADVATLSPEVFKPNQPWSSSVEYALKSASHHLLHFRIMAIWAYALHARGMPGDIQKAKYIAARIREFPLPIAQSWFEDCKQVLVSINPLPFQCTPPTEPLTWRDFY